MPSRRDFRRMTPSIMRGTAIGSMVGVLPGAGLSIASFFSYALEKKVSRHRAEMGSGAIEGVAGPEAANNAAAQTAFIPTLSLGIPRSEEHTSELQSLMRISYAVFCLKKNNIQDRR